MDTEQSANAPIAAAEPAVVKIKQMSQRDLVFNLIQGVLNGRVREAGTHMKDHLTKEEKKIVRSGIFDLIMSEAMAFKKDKSDASKVKKYASCLLCDAFKKDARYS